MARADFRRRKESRRNPVTQVSQVIDDFTESQTKMVGDVFEKDGAGPHLPDDAGDVGPQVAGVFDAAPLAGGAEWLARIARSEDIHDATPWAAVEGGNVVPDRCLIQFLCCHPRHERGRSVGFPFDVTHSSIGWIGDVDGKLKPAGTGAEGKAVEGI
nr:hypothetical protein [Magnetospirillum fulvum]